LPVGGEFLPVPRATTSRFWRPRAAPDVSAVRQAPPASGPGPRPAAGPWGAIRSRWYGMCTYQPYLQPVRPPAAVPHQPRGPPGGCPRAGLSGVFPREVAAEVGGTQQAVKAGAGVLGRSGPFSLCRGAGHGRRSGLAQDQVHRPAAADVRAGAATKPPSLPSQHVPRSRPPRASGTCPPSSGRASPGAGSSGRERPAQAISHVPCSWV
jgi:hypothetical protein